MAKTYTAKDIDFLEGLSAVRHNVGMYLGERDNQVFHTLREVVENCIDIHLKGMNKFIHIIVEDIKKGQQFTVIDRGPGIPVEKHHKTNESTLTTVLTKLHAGSNFDKQAKGKVASRGKHGVGVSVTNACSSLFEAFTFRKHWYNQSFEQGNPLNKVTKTTLPKDIKKYKVKDIGTVIRYVPDYTLLPKVKLKKDALFEWAETIADLSKGLTVRITFNGETEEFVNKNGILSILDSYKESEGNKKTTYLGKPFVYESDTVYIALQWSTLQGDDNILSYVNNASTISHGTHVQGATDAIAKAFKAIGGRGVDFGIADLKEGMILVIHYKCTDDDYAGQSKEKLNSPTAINIVKTELEKPLKAWINKNQSLAKDIVRRASEISLAKRQARELTRAASNVKITKKKGVLLAGKLAMCSKSTPAEQIELFMVEGDSAGGSCFSGDTKVRLADGSSITFEELVASDKEYTGITWNQDFCKFEPAKLIEPRLTKHTREFIVLYLSNANIERCTPEHLWMLENGSYTRAKDLRAGAVLKSLYGMVRVLRVESLIEREELPVYDLTVPETENFMLDSGVMVHNCKLARNMKFQEVLPNRGKGLNVTKATLAKALANEEIAKLVISLTGGDPKSLIKTGNITSFRVGKILLFSDADVDGKHIDALWIATLLKFAPKAFEAGMVYKVLSPLYIDSEDKTVYGFTLKEIQSKMKPQHHSRIVRCKGLGEFQAEQLEPFMNPATRKLLQIDLPTAKQMAEFNQLMGDSTEYRKQLLKIQEISI